MVRFYSQIERYNGDTFFIFPIINDRKYLKYPNNLLYIQIFNNNCDFKNQSHSNICFFRNDNKLFMYINELFLSPYFFDIKEKLRMVLRHLVLFQEYGIKN